jgi:hypothetical protein
MGLQHRFGTALMAWLLVACGQGLNWRDVRFEGVPDRVMLPCKPEQAQRKVALGVDQALLQMQGCEAQDLQFTWSHLQLPDGVKAQEVLSVWQKASLKSWGANSDASLALVPFRIRGGGDEALAVQMTASAQDRQSHFHWWVHGQHAYQLAVYAQHKPIPKEVLQNLEEGIALP